MNWVPFYNCNSNKTILVVNFYEEKKESLVGGWGQRGRRLQGEVLTLV